MALDTANKRGAAVGLLLTFRFIAPGPDGSLSTQSDRQQMAGAYPLASEPPPSTGAGGSGVKRGAQRLRKRRKQEPPTPLERAIALGYLSPERQAAFFAAEQAEQDAVVRMTILAMGYLALDFLEDA